MKNIFKTNTVEGIVANLTTTIEKLDKLRTTKLEEAAVSQALIETTTQKRKESLEEAARAEKIAINIEKLLDIR